MNYLFLPLILITSNLYGQLTLQSAKDSLQKYHMSEYSYMTEFEGYKAYGSPVILTHDGGAAAFGHGDKGVALLKLDKTGKKQWEKLVTPQFDELEAQAVAQDKLGNFYVYMISYDSKRYRGGAERVICYDKTGKQLWDKTLGNYTVMNSPMVSYIKTLPDGRIYMRGHIVTDKPEEDKDPKYRYWEGWLNAKGVMTQKVNDIIDWTKDDWQKKFKMD